MGTLGFPSQFKILSLFPIKRVKHNETMIQEMRKEKPHILREGNYFPFPGNEGKTGGKKQKKEKEITDLP